MKIDPIYLPNERYLHLMTPHIEACRESLLQIMVLLEGTLTQPLGLTYDLRSLLRTMDNGQSFADRVPEGNANNPRNRRMRTTLDRALEAAALGEQHVAHLLALDKLDNDWGSKAMKILPRVKDRLGLELRRSISKKIKGLYVLLDPTYLKQDILGAAKKILSGGATTLQWRAKNIDKGDQLETCRRLMDLCNQTDSLLIINDHPDLALACGAHGVHLGQHDLSIPDARRILTPTQITGKSNATMDEALESESDGADYLAVGAIFPTTSKNNTRHAGIEILKEVRSSTSLPIVAISGINEANVEEVIFAGADCIAVISAVITEDDPGEATRRLNERIQTALIKRMPNE